MNIFVFRVTLCLSFFSTQAFSATEPQYVAEAGAISGKVYVLRGGEKIGVVKGMKLLSIDQLVTSKNSAAEIIFADGSNFLAHEEASIKIEDYRTVLKGDKMSVHSVMNQVKGKVRYFFRPRAGGRESTVKTKNTVMGIRGTAFYVDNNDNKETTLTVIRGQVQVANAATPEEKVEVKENQTTQISENKKPEEPKMLPPAEIQKLFEEDKKTLSEKSVDGFIPDTLELPAPVVIQEKVALKSIPTAVEAKKEESSTYCKVFPCSPKITQEMPICSNDSINQYIQRAQQFEPETTLWAQNLLQCPGVEDEILFWLSFYHKGKGEMSRAAEVGYLVPPPPNANDPSVPERARIIHQAVVGDGKALMDAVTAKKKGFEDSEAYLVLARTLARNGSFEKSREMYEKALGLRTISSDKSKIEIESAHTFLLEGQFESAKEQFDEVLRKPMNQAETDRATRGHNVATSNRYDVKAEENIMVRGGQEKVTNNVKFKKVFGQVFWENRFGNLQATNYQLEMAENDEEKKYRGNEITLRGRHKVLHGLTAEGMVGYIAFEKSKVPWEVLAQLEYQNGLKASVGANSIPLFWNEVVDSTSGMYSQDHYYLGVGFEDLIKFKGGIFNVENNGGTKISLESKIALLPLPPKEHFHLILDVSQLTYKDPNPHYFSPLSWTTFSASLSFLSKISQKFSLAANLKLESFLQKLHSDLGIYANSPWEKIASAESGSQLTLGGGIHYNPTHNWKIFLNGGSIKMTSSENTTLQDTVQVSLGVNMSL